MGGAVGKLLELSIGPRKVSSGCFEPFLGGFAVRRIAHAGRDEQIAIGAHWTQTDLDWELSAILALGEQVEARAHWPRVRISLIPGAMCPVPAAESLGQQHF